MTNDGLTVTPCQPDDQDHIGALCFDLNRDPEPQVSALNLALAGSKPQLAVVTPSPFLAATASGQPQLVPTSQDELPRALAGQIRPGHAEP